MGRHCCKCCPGSSFCGCCCTKRFATSFFALAGTALAIGAILAPIYVHMTDEQFSKLFPAIKISKEFISSQEGGEGGAGSRQGWIVFDDEKGIEVEYEDPVEDVVQDDENGRKRVIFKQTPKETYRLAIFQLLDDIDVNSPTLALISFCIGCINLPIHLLLLAGALCRSPCLMLPWLAITLLEHLILGVPLIVFSGIIALYLGFQLKLYFVAAAIVGGIVALILVSLSSWFTVYACYNQFYRRQDYYYENGMCANEATQPLLPPSSNGRPSGSAAPPGQSGSNGGYHLGHYPHYYPHQSRQLPSAPPAATGMYPHLPNA